MNRIYLLLFSVVLLTGCSHKSEFEQSAGDLTKEIKYVYNYFVASNSARPEFVAERWCEQHHSWDYEDCGPDGYAVYTENEKSLVKRITMKGKTSYSANIYYTLLISGTDHGEVCKKLRDIFGEPLRVRTLHGGDYCEWKTIDNIEVAVEKSSVLSYVSFILCQ